MASFKDYKKAIVNVTIDLSAILAGLLIGKFLLMIF